MLLTRKSLVLKGALFIVTGVLLVACGNEKPKDETLGTVQDTTTAVAETPSVSYSLPSPLQVASIFKKSGLKYKAGVTNSLKDPSKYTTNLSKAINLGVYRADLSDRKS